AEGAVHDVDRLVVVLAERPDRGATEVRPRGVAAVAHEGGVHHLEPAAPHEDGAAAAALGGVAGGVAVGEGQVLHCQLRGVLVLAAGGPVALAGSPMPTSGSLGGAEPHPVAASAQPSASITAQTSRARAGARAARAGRAGGTRRCYGYAARPARSRPRPLLRA